MTLYGSKSSYIPVTCSEQDGHAVRRSLHTQGHFANRSRRQFSYVPKAYRVISFRPDRIRNVHH